MAHGELRRLLSPVPPEDFIERYWERAPLHISGSPGKFQDIFSWDRFYGAVADSQARGISIRVSLDSDRNPGELSTHVRIRADEIDDYLDRGASICVDPIDRGDSQLSDFARQIARELNYVGDVSVKAYISSDGCGFNTHFDHGIATTLQIDGRKRWRFSDAPAVAFPSDNALVEPGGGVRYVGRLNSSLATWERVARVDESAFREVVLEPGDVLCLPAGTWHNAKAVGGSFALNVSFDPLDFLGFFNAAVGAHLRDRPEWRRGLPLVLRPDGGSSASQALIDFFGGRLAELRSLLADLDPAVGGLHEVWRTLADQPLSRSVGPAFALSADPDAKRGTMEPSAPQRRVSRSFGGASAGVQPSQAASSSASAQQDASMPAGGSVDDRHSPRGRTEAYTGRMTCTICVRNLDAAIAWYTATLGFRLVYRLDTFSWCELTTPAAGVTVGLFEVERVETAGGAVLTFEVRDLDAMRARLETLDVRFEGPTRVIQNVVKLATLFDPDGTRLNLSESLQ